MDRIVETEIGTVRVTLYRSEESSPQGPVMVALVEDAHSRTEDPPDPCVVNRIPVRFSEWFEAPLTSDLSLDASWRNKSGSVTRLDRFGYNDATGNQKSTVWRAARQVVLDLFADPQFAYGVIIADQQAKLQRLRTEATNKLRELDEAQAAVELAEAALTDMELMLDPPDPELDLPDRMVFEDERQRVFGLGVHAEPDLPSEG